MNPLLSILTPAVPSRFSDTTYSDPPQQGSLEILMRKLEKQIGNLPVEHLILCDNKRRTVGEKRDALLRIARGEYVAFVDDDDDVSDDYVFELLKAAMGCPDVVTFNQQCVVNGIDFQVQFKLGNPNEPQMGFATIKRNAWHVCAWRRTLAIQSRFPVSNYGEDWAFAAPLCALPGLSEVHIPKVLHYYRHSTETTEAPPPV